MSKVSLIKKLTWLYISTAVAVSSLAIGGQILTQRSLQAQSEDGRVINVAGRQRMLSQKIAKTAHTLSPTRSSSEANEAVIEELSTALKQFELAHQGLTSGSAELGLSRSNSAAVSELFAELEPDYQRLTKAAASMLNAASAADFEQRFSPETLASIDVGERQFLPEMNAIVVQYEQEAIANLNRLATIQRVLLVLTLLALVPVSLPLAQVIRRVKAAIATMQKSGVQVVSSSFQISASGKQLEAMVAEQAAASTQITASSREIATTARSLSQNVEAVMQSAVQTQQMAESGSQDLAAMAAIIDQMAQMTQAMALKLGTINDRASAIDQVVFAMTKVADQTNLLSLNAAIEAEKAGEYGLGFAVVAREIRRLSDQTSVAALDIDALVKEMQAAVAVGSAEVGRFSQQVNEGTDSAKKITQQAGVMSAQMQALLPSLAAVNQGIASQSSSASQIQDAMEQLSGGTGQTVQALQEINGALEQLQDVATRLQQEQVMA